MKTWFILFCVQTICFYYILFVLQLKVCLKKPICLPNQLDGKQVGTRFLFLEQLNVDIEDLEFQCLNCRVYMNFVYFKFTCELFVDLQWVYASK